MVTLRAVKDMPFEGIDKGKTWHVKKLSGLPRVWVNMRCVEVVKSEDKPELAADPPKVRVEVKPKAKNKVAKVAEPAATPDAGGD